MERWQLTKRDLKKYPHFDPELGVKEAMALATDPLRVARHEFYPFMLYEQRWTRFAIKGERGDVKTRPIRYAARSDAYIFSYYRHLLSCRYETELTNLGLGDSIIAYRRIANPPGKRGKCNINFVYDAIQKIRGLGDCCVVALDISSYFKSLDHARLKAIWSRLMGVSRLPDDQFRVFEAVTHYSVVDKQAVYTRLGHFGEKRRTKSGKAINGYLTPHDKIPRQLCTGFDFRQKICGGNGQKSLIRQNHKSYGIPQGSAISDVLANLYLIDFDKSVCEWAQTAGGAYYRYSDDILIIMPGGEPEGVKMMTDVSSFIRGFGSHLTVKDNKSSVFVFTRQGDRQRVSLAAGKKGRNGLEYLGFRYDGQCIFIRDATISGLRRKVVRAARREANALARRYPDKNALQLKSLFNYERLIKKFGRVEDFGEKQHDYRNWTFWSYASRASEVFGPLGRRISRQLRHYPYTVRRRADTEIERAVIRREARLAPAATSPGTATRP